MMGLICGYMCISVRHARCSVVHSLVQLRCTVGARLVHFGCNRGVVWWFNNICVHYWCTLGAIVVRLCDLITRWCTFGALCVHLWCTVGDFWWAFGVWCTIGALWVHLRCTFQCYSDLADFDKVSNIFKGRLHMITCVFTWTQTTTTNVGCPLMAGMMLGPQWFMDSVSFPTNLIWNLHVWSLPVGSMQVTYMFEAHLFEAYLYCKQLV
jgi:hypothetical protein